MTSGNQDPVLGGKPVGIVADKGALIATFYCRRGVAPTRALHQGFCRSMARTQEAIIPDEAIPSDWHDPHNREFGRCFDPPAAHDTTVIQLAFNARGDATHAWTSTRERLEEVLDALGLSTAWWGYTLTYQAVLASGIDADFALNELRAVVRRLHSSEDLQLLAQAEMSGGKVWLLDVPMRGDGLAAATVYVALSPPDKEQAFVTKVVYGLDAELLMPDLLAHKGYHQMRQYRGGGLQSKFEGRIASLEEASSELLTHDFAHDAYADPSELEGAYQRFIPVVSKLKELQISLVRQLYNYDWWRAQMEENGIIEYHRSHLRMAGAEVELLNEEFRRVMEMSRTVLSIAQLHISNAQANRQWWTTTLIAVVGFALGLQGILDRELIGKLLGLVPILEPLSGSFLVRLGTQLGILLTFLLLAALAVIRFNMRRLQRRTPERE